MIAAAGAHGDTYEHHLAEAPPAQPAADTPPVPVQENDGRETPPAADATPADKPEIVPHPESKEEVKELDEVDKYLAEISKETPVVNWDDAGKAAFKGTFGEEDPQAFLQKHNTLQEQLGVATEKAQQADAVLKRIGTMPYELAKAMEAVAQGKPYQDYLKQLGTGATLSKAGKDVADEAIMDRYYPGKFSAEQREAIKDGSADEALKALWDERVEMGREKHDALRDTERSALTAKQEADKAFEAASQKADMAAVAYLKQKPGIAAFASKPIIDKFLSGDLEREVLYNADGTRKPESLALLLQAMNHEKVVARMREGARVQGKTEAELKAHNKLPGTPDPANGHRGSPPQKETPIQQQERQALTQVADLMGLTT